MLPFTEWPIENENEGRRETEKYKQIKKSTQITTLLLHRILKFNDGY